MLVFFTLKLCIKNNLKMKRLNNTTFIYTIEITDVVMNDFEILLGIASIDSLGLHLEKWNLDSLVKKLTWYNLQAQHDRRHAD